MTTLKQFAACRALNGRALQWWIALLAIGLSASFCAAASQSEFTITIKDFVTMPMTGSVDGRGIQQYLARENYLRQEPGGKRRIFINDLNGPLYILDAKTKQLTTYLDLNGSAGHTGLFHKLTTPLGLANGFVNFIFDPDYAHNGKFYTLHVEDPSLPGSDLPDNTRFPGFDTKGYSATEPVHTPGRIERQSVLIEWTDTNINDSKFEGTARELLRVDMNTESHPMGALIFNPAAKPGDPDWRVLYIGCGDGRSGESMNPAMRLTPQRLDTMVGKILRIVPDLNEHTETSTVSDNGRYRIPNDNPFASTPGARKEIWAYGLRNPNKLSWYVDPADPSRNTLFAAVVGLHTWEMVDIIHKGANYGYPLREGDEQLNADNKTSPLPAVDKIPIRLNATETLGMVTPTYPVIAYPHNKDGGDAITSGFVYTGKIAALRGKYIFGDITTGHIWYCSFNDLLAADKSSPHAPAKMHEVQIVWDKPGGASQPYSSMAPITEAAFHERGGKSPILPGRAPVSGGRSDIRFCMDLEGRLYILSKSDGVIREVVAASGD